MLKKIIFMVVSAFILNINAGEEFSLEMQKQYSPNLLKNTGFEKLDKARKPLHWHFDNCSRSSDIKPGIKAKGAIDKFAALITTAGNLYGYWMQEVSVIEGKTYYASVNFKVYKAKGLLWIKTGQYHDGKSALHHPRSSTVLMDVAAYEHGESLKKILQDFIEPAYLQGVSSDKWNEYSVEFTVPKGHGIDKYAFRTGAYGGNSGWIMVDNVYFGLAKYKLKLTVTGKNLKSLRIINANNKEIFSQNIAGRNGKVIFEVELPSRQERYFVEIKDVNGKSYRRDI
jgi:hypothetical protein